MAYRKTIRKNHGKKKASRASRKGSLKRGRRATRKGGLKRGGCQPWPLCMGHIYHGKSNIM